MTTRPDPALPHPLALLLDGRTMRQAAMSTSPNSRRRGECANNFINNFCFCIWHLSAAVLATTQIKFIVSDISLVIIITHIYYLFINLFCMRIMRAKPHAQAPTRSTRVHPCAQWD